MHFSKYLAIASLALIIISASTKADARPYKNDVRIFDYTGPLKGCTNSISPIIQLQNFGTNPLYFVTILTFVDGKLYSNSQWKGTLQQYEIRTIALTEILFSSPPPHSIKFIAIQPNGIPDEDATNNEINVMYQAAAQTKEKIRIFISPDSEPQQTTWNVKNSTGKLIAAGGPYTSNQEITEIVQLPYEDCYSFTIFDSAGNGLQGRTTNGFYIVTGMDGTIIATGGNFAYSETTPFFSVPQIPSNIENITTADLFEITPNPTSDFLTINLNNCKHNRAEIQIVSLNGKNVFKQVLENLQNGSNNFKIDCRNFPKGLLLVTFRINGEIHTKRLMIF